MREWLTVIIVLLILGILLDGLRRMRQHRRESLRLSRRAMEADREDPGLDQEPAIEFPRSKARVVGYRDPDTAVNVNQHLKENHAASKITRGAPGRLPEQVALNLGESVPMLMESVDDERQPVAAPSESTREQSEQPQERGEPSLGSLDNLDDLDAPLPEESSAASKSSNPWDDYEQSEDVLMRPRRPAKAAASPIADSELEPEPERTEAPSVAAAEAEPSTFDEQPQAKTTSKRNYGASEATPEPSEPVSAKASQEEEAARNMPDEVLIINVMARRDQKFTGEALLQSLLEQGLRLGDMDIFHRHESPDGEGKIIFSAANMVVPGTFDLDTMEQFDTPGISMFLSLPISGNSLDAYNLMAKTAQNLAAQLGGELKDENRSVMTRQTIEHERQRVIEYERKRRLAKA